MVERGSSDAGRGVRWCDDTGLPTQGTASVGVQRHSGGPRGTIATCHVVLTAPSSAARRHWPIGSRRSLPEQWADAGDRRRRARRPAAVAVATTPQLAVPVLDEARTARVAQRAVTAAAGAGDRPDCLAGMLARPAPASVQVQQPGGVRLPAAVAAAAARPAPRGRRPGRPRADGTAPSAPPARRGRPRTQPQPLPLAPLASAQALRAAVAAPEWQTVTVLDPWQRGRQRPACRLRLHRGHGLVTGPAGWLIGERPRPGQEGARTWSVAWQLAARARADHRRVGQQRWALERFQHEGNQALGRGESQGRTWPGVERHLALVCLRWCAARLLAAADHPATAAAGSADPAPCSPRAQSPGRPPAAPRGLSAVIRWVCHPERSEGSRAPRHEIPHSVRDDTGRHCSDHA